MVLKGILPKAGGNFLTVESYACYDTANGSYRH